MIDPAAAAYTAAELCGVFALMWSEFICDRQQVL